MKKVVRSLYELCILSGLPILEYILLRFYFHSNLNLKIGWVFFTDYELILPFMVAGFLWLYTGSSSVDFKLRRKQCLVHLFFLALFVSVGLNYSRLISFCGIGWAYAFFWGASFSSFISSLFVALPEGYFKFSHRCTQLIYCGLIAFSSAAVSGLTPVLWPKVFRFYGFWFSKAILLFSGGTGSVEIIPYREELLLKLRNPSFNMNIGGGCSGADGIALLLLSLGLFGCIRRWHLRSGPLMVGAFLTVGVAWMSLVNMARLLLLGFFGRGLVYWVGWQKGQSLFQGFAHVHLGWILDFLCIFLYSWFCETLVSFSHGLKVKNQVQGYDLLVKRGRRHQRFNT